MAEALTWAGIVLCVAQSGMFSGLNLALFGVSRLRLEVASSGGNAQATRVLRLREDSNFTLTTVLWGNVGTNVLLTLLSDSVLAGVAAFTFSTVVITLVGEIFPQAYFSRHALRMASLLAPFLRFYQLVLYPVAKPAAKILDWWLGKEGIHYFRERDLRMVIEKHIEADEAEIDQLEGVGALNFLELDDLLVSEEGEIVDPESVVSLPTERGEPVFPDFEQTPNAPFLQRIQRSGRPWVIFTDPEGEPTLVLEVDAFLRDALFRSGPIQVRAYCHRPIVVKDSRTPLGHVIERLRVQPERAGDDVIDRDLILLWATEKRIVTGSDILGRLLRGIVRHDVPASRSRGHRPPGSEPTDEVPPPGDRQS